MQKLEDKNAEVRRQNAEVRSRRQNAECRSQKAEGKRQNEKQCCIPNPLALQLRSSKPNADSSDLKVLGMTLQMG
ncbi:MAG: hypothetical protein AUG89_07370 [Acidobacteria bacterium 13_1_20CM_4_56_7]|jgi:hypothetical protein|nr:MAG: hypothetical protein AUG89_07370 [Acidobacteria bacterium 13_1_20CM_4_56_7]